MEYVLSIIGIPRYSLKRVLAPFRDFLLHLHDHVIPNARNNYHPHILGHRSLVLLSGLLITVKIFTLSMLSAGPILPAYSSAITIENIISLTNQSRQEYKLGTLRENSLLNAAAQTKANDMLKNSYFSHNTPEGKTPWDFITKAGYSYLMAGENLAVNFTEAENVETAWMNSPGHKANIVNKNFEEIGIGIAQGEYQGNTAIFVVQMFGVPVEQKVSLSETPTKVQTTPAPLPKIEEKSPAVASAKTVETFAKAQAEKIVPAVPLKVERGSTLVEGENIKISAVVTGPAVKVVAYFGKEAVMLSPKTDSLWEGAIVLNKLAEKNASVRLRAFAMDGQTDQLQLADFSAGTLENYNVSAGITPAAVNFFGRALNVKSFESNFYLFFVAVMLSCLVLAIAVKRHIQHLSLIANSSFVIIFAILMWWAG